MAYKLSPELSEALLGQFKTTMDGCFVHIFAGPVPASPGAALNMGSLHTLLGIASVDGDGSTGLTFDAADGEVLAKADDETWAGNYAFDGANDSEPTLDAAFFRVAPTADNCQGTGTGPRLQGTITATGMGGDMERETVACDDGQPFVLPTFVVRIGSIT